MAVLFHIIGVIGILFYDREFFVATSSLNLLLMFGLILFSKQTASRSFILFFLICFFGGIFVELIGTKTAWLFGEYRYGTVLGPSAYGVPLIIGINWFIVMYCCGIAVHTLLRKVSGGQHQKDIPVSAGLRFWALIIDGATLAVLFDWLMEPVAVKLGYWTWLGDGSIPLYNYLCWFAISLVFMLLFNILEFEKRNKFALHLLGIQALFFLVLRTFL